MMAGTGKSQKSSSEKRTKAQKKQLKLENQRQQFQESLKGKNIETVVYNNPDATSARKSRQAAREQVESLSTNETNTTPGIDLDMRATRFEIMKFGINSLKSKDLEDAETSLAISLGARPNKRTAVNYKDLQVQRKKARELEQEEASMSIKPRLNVAGKKKPQGDGKNKKGKGRKHDAESTQGAGRGRATGRDSKMPRKRNNR